MPNEFFVLAGTAAAIAFLHTVLGPDHYLPFIVLSKARKWSGIKTLVVTFLCGMGHVLSSVVLGFVGIAMGTAIFKLETIESFRGEIAAWLLITFGFTYFIWGIRRAILNRPHEHSHLHKDEDSHKHTHKHSGDHFHTHDSKTGGSTIWILFIIFVFGPCEPLIPLVMYPAAKGSILTVILVASIFALITIGTMLFLVLVSYYGLSGISFHRFEKYSHALAGSTIFLCGGAIKLLGL